MIDRRSFFRGLAALAAVPLLAKVPVIQRVGAWAEVKITDGVITSVTITNAGSGYTSPPLRSGYTPPLRTPPLRSPPSVAIAGGRIVSVTITDDVGPDA